MRQTWKAFSRVERVAVAILAFDLLSAIVMGGLAGRIYLERFLDPGPPPAVAHYNFTREELNNPKYWSQYPDDLVPIVGTASQMILDDVITPAPNEEPQTYMWGNSDYQLYQLQGDCLAGKPNGSTSWPHEITNSCRK